MRGRRFIPGFLLAIAPLLYAQYGERPVPNPYTAAPQRQLIARVSAVQGDVNIRRGGVGELIPAVTNVPLTVRDHLQTSAGSRAEVEFDPANLVRLAPNTDVGISGFQYRRYQLQFTSGTILYRVFHDFAAQVLIKMPFGLTGSPQLRGEYRMSVLEDGSVRLTVRSGRLEVFSPHGTRLLSPGQTWLVRRSEFEPTYEAARDHFDEWSAYRDRRLAANEEEYGNGGWKRFGDPGAHNPNAQGFRDGEEHSGWHSFGQPEHPGEEPQR